ncbi:M14 metallopeptidase family protein [Flagellimonas sp. S3867]|uniref:M14 family metallopeptidase n=1 Tax=Flagellimonas sp. S3867 TaxID=2768063 RepID=UPI0016885C3A|nr:M14 metallopeptidase family protein [Flagellimonas sp. S3867]
MMNHGNFKEESIKGRYITLDRLENYLTKLKISETKVEGESVNGRPIKSLLLGKGSLKILMWSQMHGNESTTTKAVLDLVNFLKSQNKIAQSIVETCTLLIVPILNPDGAKNYTRVNANAVDLNRDAKQLTQPESKVLCKLFNEFKPAYCFNLHDQRTLFSVGNSNKPATVSFLSPSSDESRKLTPTRETAMRLIVAMNAKLQALIPGQVGRYDDGFNENCVGDSFQMEAVPTILFEAGHYPNDYQREKTREFIFYALVGGIETISNGNIEEFKTDDYFKIPENEKLFYDILVYNAENVNSELESNTGVGIRYKEVLEDNMINFVPEIAEIENVEGFFGHETFDCTNTEDLNLLNKRKDVLDLLQDVRKL